MNHEPEPHHDWFLREVLGVGDVAHSGRTLYDHLVGTYRLLSLWRCGRPVQLAGLFHSIYGTNAFQHRCLYAEREDERHLLATVIGERAEHLVYLFGTIKRPAALLKPSALAQQDRADLIQVEVANLLEQGGNEKTLRKLLDCPQLLTAPQKAISTRLKPMLIKEREAEVAAAERWRASASRT